MALANRTLPIGALLALPLVLAGCSDGGGGESAAPPGPQPVRNLVAWSDTMCTNTKLVDGLRTKIDSVNQPPGEPATKVVTYVQDVAIDVRQVTDALKGLAASGIPAADGLASELTGALDRLRPQLDSRTIPDLPDDQKLARAQQIAGAINAIRPQAPALTEVVNREPNFAASYNVAPNCDPVGPASTRPLVLWSDAMCRGEKTLAELTSDPFDDPALKDPRFARAKSAILGSYLSSAPDDLDQLTQQLGKPQPTGIKEADDYRASLLAAAQAAAPKVPREQFGSYHSQPPEQVEAKAREVAAALATIKPAGPDLPAVVAGNPALGTARDLAPGCPPPGQGGASTTPLPPAANGTDLGACQDGDCEVVVSGPVDIPINGQTYTAVAGPSGVTLVSGSGYIRVSGGGIASFGSGGKTVRFKLLGQNETGAVLQISTS